jgi:uncharacterized protein YcbK (DUF882 family)
VKLTKNFSLDEFKCNDGTDVPDELRDNVQELANNLQVLRDHFNKPISINSGYRSPKHNKKVGGSPKSQHLLATAADITVDGYKPSEVYKAIVQLIEEGKMKEGGLGRYNSFTHYDIRGTKARWDFR